MSRVFVSLALSLALTLIFELGFTLLWGVKREDLQLVVLVNVLTNPVVVLCHRAALLWWPGAILWVTAALELGAVAAEGYLYQTRSRVRFPWAFSICVNLFSFTIGLLLEGGF